MAQIVFAPLAFLDLQKIRPDVLYVPEDETLTKDYLAGLLAAISNKAEFPHSGTPFLIEGRDTGYYSVRFKAYLVFYRVEEEKMLVERILPGRSDFVALLFS